MCLIITMKVYKLSISCNQIVYYLFIMINYTNTKLPLTYFSKFLSSTLKSNFLNSLE